MKVTVIILTFNEERHIARAIQSVGSFCSDVYVVDSYSTDQTANIAISLGAQVLQNKFINHAQQFNWALENIDVETDWIFRLDADEIVSKELAHSISNTLPKVNNSIVGANILRRVSFLGKPIMHGGVFPTRITRIFRSGAGRSEERWMDEHIVVSGDTITLEGELLDDNLQPLDWWINKHNRYSSLEAVQILLTDQNVHLRSENRLSDHAYLKRFIKEKFYLKLPLGIRAIFYFLYRFIIRFGFLDGKEGRAFHFLQACWYRYLVDLKLHEVRSYMRRNDACTREAIRVVLGIEVE